VSGLTGGNFGIDRVLGMSLNFLSPVGVKFLTLWFFAFSSLENCIPV
jgi:hypothetical protein